MFTKNLEFLGQPSGGGFQRGNGRFNDAGYRVRARPPVQDICATSGDIARHLCMYRCRARLGYTDLVHHDHKCCRRYLRANWVFGRRLAQEPGISQQI